MSWTPRTRSVYPISLPPLVRSIVALSAVELPLETTPAYNENLSSVNGMESALRLCARKVDEHMREFDSSSVAFMETEAEARIKRGDSYESTLAWLESQLAELKLLFSDVEADRIRRRNGTSLQAWLKANTAEAGQNAVAALSIVPRTSASASEAEVLKRLGLTPEQLAKYD